MVNNLGGTSILELGIMTNAAIHCLTQHHKLRVERVYAGSFMTSLAMAGVSLTVLQLTPTAGRPAPAIHGGEQLSFSECLDFPTFAPGWQASSQALAVDGHGTLRTDRPPLPCSTDYNVQAGEYAATSAIKPVIPGPTGALVKASLKAAARSLMIAEAELNHLDALTGDGDCGSTMAEGARHLLEHLETIPVDDPVCGHERRPYSKWGRGNSLCNGGQRGGEGKREPECKAGNISVMLGHANLKTMVVAVVVLLEGEGLGRYRKGAVAVAPVEGGRNLGSGRPIHSRRPHQHPKDVQFTLVAALTSIPSHRELLCNPFAPNQVATLAVVGRHMGEQMGGSAGKQVLDNPGLTADFAPSHTHRTLL